MEPVTRGDAPQAADGRVPGRTRILIADDDRELRDALADVLRGEGYEVDLADDGQAVLDAMTDRKRRPALVLLDLMMPKLNGFQVIEALSTTPAAASTVVMVLSGLENAASPTPRVRWVRKPIDPPDLLATIRAALAPSS